MAQDQTHTEQKPVANSPWTAVQGCLMILGLLCVVFLVGLSIREAAREKWGRFPPVNIQCAVGEFTGEVSPEGKIKLRTGKLCLIGEGDTFTIPSNKLLVIFVEECNFNGKIEFDRKYCEEVDSIEHACILRPRKEGGCVIAVKSEQGIFNTISARTRFSLNVVRPIKVVDVLPKKPNPEYIDINVGYMRGFYEDGGTYFGLVRNGLIDLADPRLTVDAG